MAFIPGGVYEMGSKKSLMEIQMDPTDILNPDRHTLGPEDPAHEVDIDAFYIDLYEVTNADYRKFLEAANHEKPRFWEDPELNDPRQPVVGVSWTDAERYCAWNKKRLPTEAEWEKAARGKKPVTYPWGEDPPDKSKLNFNDEFKKPLPVGSFEAGKSDHGVYDLSGNVAEWVQDWHWAQYYLFSAKKNPRGPKKGQYKVVRGGHWMSVPDDTRLTYRNASVPSVKNKLFGFRCVKDARQPGD
ncbi:MAG: formylglycine-generating enzyme family protein [Nitrospinae bacterium]|nr:formylglycine-generating enzyme family protein [Nitrospinota bacterium]